MKKKSFNLAEQFQLGSATDQITVRLLLAYTLIMCGEFPL